MSAQYKVWRRNGKIKVQINYEMAGDDHYLDKDEVSGRLAVTVPWITKHLGTWTDFDYTFSIDLFCDSLEALGKGMMDSYCVNSVKSGRRAIAASKMLRSAYEHSSSDDKSYRGWAKGYGWGIIHKRGKYPPNAMGMNPKTYGDKMFAIIVKRQQRLEKSLQDDAWAFIIKYIQHWWN